MPMDVYIDIVEETKRGTKGIDLANKHKVSYTTISRIRSHARKAGLLEMTEKSKKMIKTKSARKSQRKFREKQENKRMLMIAEPAIIPKKDPEFIKVDFKGTEIHVEKSGKIMITTEGITVR
jgi:hypothetical protein